MATPEAVYKSWRQSNAVMNDSFTEWFMAERGHSYMMTNSAPSTLLLGATSFDATNPLLVLDQSAATNRLHLKKLVLTQEGTVAGGVISIVIAIDNIARYSSGGTSSDPKNVNIASTNTTGAVGYVAESGKAITALAASSSVIYVPHRGTPATVGTTTIVDLSSFIIPTTGSLLVYAWATGTGPSFNCDLSFNDIV